ncbi:apoptotic protease-activating factor 1-like [Clytia hemisphaerica]|uniref:CARD domain-containing protein n=1 Tax=Clytia hemisphaerica TaxID=252671 RepID=A0A7M5VGM1_9CNID
MNEEQRFILISNRKAISQDLLVGDVFSYLQSKFVLDIDEVELIKGELTSREKAEKLVETLLSKKRNFFRHFYKSLKFAEYDHLCELLESGVDDVESSDEDGSSSSDDEDSDVGDLPKVETILRNGGVPQIPQIFVDRPQCIQKIQDALNALEEDIGWVVFHGMAGSGKTLLASDGLNNEPLVHRCFPGGIFWVNVGKVDNARLLMKMQNLCHWLDNDGLYRTPKNVEEARDRLRILFSLEHPKSLLVLDDVWSDNVLKYFDVRCRTLLITRNPAIANTLSGNIINVQIKETLTFSQSQQVLALWTNMEIKDLPEESNSIINQCQGSPLAISMIGALLKGHKNRWSYYVKQLDEQKISKVKSKLSYDYTSLYDAFAVSFNDLSDELQEHFEKLSIFNESIGIPVETLSILWDCDEVETEDMMDELIGRSLVTSNTSNEDDEKKTCYFVHDIQLGFIKEKMTEKKKIKGFHQLLIDRYLERHGDFKDIPDDGYIHWYLISHLIMADDVTTAVQLMKDLFWLQRCLDSTSPVSLITQFNALLDAMSSSSTNYQESVELLSDIRRLIGAHSHLFASEEDDKMNLTQLALIQPSSNQVLKIALENGKTKLKEKSDSVFYQWLNRPKEIQDDLTLSIKVHVDQVNCCRLDHSKENPTVVSCGSDHLVKVWDSVNGKILSTLEGHSDSVNCCCFSSDDKRIITASSDCTIRTWSLMNETELKCLRGHRSDVLCCQCSNDDQFLCSASVDSTVKIWDMETGFLVCSFDEHEDVVNWCCFSHDSKMVASCSNDQSLKIWDIDSRECQTQWCDEDFIAFCIFTPDDEQVLYTIGDQIKIFNLSDEMVEKTIETPSDVLSLAFSPNQQYLASAHTDMSARLYDLENEVFVRVYTGHSSWLTSVCFCQSNRTLVTSSADGICNVWSLNTENYSTEKLIPVFDASFLDPEHPFIAACSNKNQVKMFRMIGLAGESPAFKMSISSCKISRNEKMLAVGLSNGNIEVMEIKAIEDSPKISFHQSSTFEKHKKAIVKLEFTRNDELLMSCDEEIITIWDVASKELYRTYEYHTETITKCLTFDNGKYLASTSYDGNFKIMNVETNLEVFCYENEENAMMSCTVTLDNKMVAACSSNNQCKIWSFDEGQLLHTLEENDVIRTIQFSGDNKFIATGCDNGSVKIWNTKMGRLKTEMKDHTGWITDIKFDRKSHLVQTVSDNLKFFNTKGDRLQTIPLIGHYLTAVLPSDDFTLCITVDNQGYLYVLQMV